MCGRTRGLRCQEGNTLPWYEQTATPQFTAEPPPGCQGARHSSAPGSFAAEDPALINRFSITPIPALQIGGPCFFAEVVHIDITTAQNKTFQFLSVPTACHNPLMDSRWEELKVTSLEKKCSPNLPSKSNLHEERAADPQPLTPVTPWSRRLPSGSARPAQELQAPHSARSNPGGLQSRSRVLSS